MKSNGTIFEVVVGNIGSVYAGNNYLRASSKFANYTKASKANFGRASGESVVLFHNGEIKKEYVGTLTESECDCMRCEETFTTTTVEDFCPKCRTNPNYPL